MKRFIAIFLTVSFTGLTAFAADPATTRDKTAKGAVIGAVAGGIIGAVVGNNRGKGNAKRGTIVGAVAGTAIGAGLRPFWYSARDRTRRHSAGIWR